MTDKTITLQNLQCFEDVYKKYRDDIFLYVKNTFHLSREDAEDITGSAFLELLKIWQDFEPNSDQKAFTWLRTTARFLTYNSIRKKSMLPEVSVEELPEFYMNIDMNLDIDISNILADRDLCEKMLRKLKDELDFEEYQLIDDIIIKGRDIVQISREKNINVNTLYSRWRRLKTKMRSL